MILFLDLMLFIVIALVLLSFITQVAIPWKNKTPLFPLLRKSETAEKIEEASEELEHVAELEQLAEMQEEINRRKAQLMKDEK